MYAPISIEVYCAAYAGMMGALANTRQTTNALALGYDHDTKVAGAFAQAFDTAYNNALPNILQLDEIPNIIGEVFSSAYPTGLPSESPTGLAYVGLANAVIGRMQQADTFVAAQGIVPPTGTTIPSLNLVTIAGIGPTTLEGTVPAAFAIANVAGYNTSGDGGGGAFYWDTTSVVADNGGTIINPTGHVGAGRWVRVFDGIPTILMFGADKTGVADSTAAYDLVAANFPEYVWPPGTYKLPAGLSTHRADVTHRLADGVMLRLGAAFLVKHNSNHILGRSFDFDSPYNVTYTGAALDVNVFDYTGAGTGDANSCHLEGVRIDCGFGTGIAKRTTGFALGAAGFAGGGYTWRNFGADNAYVGMNCRSNCQQVNFYEGYFLHPDGLQSPKACILTGTGADYLGANTTQKFSGGSINGFQGGIEMGGGAIGGVSDIKFLDFDIEQFTVGQAYIAKVNQAFGYEVAGIHSECTTHDPLTRGVIMGKAGNKVAQAGHIHDNEIEGFRYAVEGINWNGFVVDSNILDLSGGVVGAPSGGFLNSKEVTGVNGEWKAQKRMLTAVFYDGDVPDTTGFLRVEPTNLNATDGTTQPSYAGSGLTGSMCDLKVGQIRGTTYIGVHLVGQTPVNIVSTSNTTPVVVQASHNLRTGDSATIAGVTGALNQTWVVTVVDGTHLSLNGSVASGAFGAVGTIQGIATLKVQSGDTLELAGLTQIDGTNRLTGSLVWLNTENPTWSQDDAATFARDSSINAQNAVSGNNHGANLLVQTGSGNGTQAPGFFQVFLGQAGKGNGQVQGVIASANAALSQQTWDWGAIVSSLQCSGSRFIINNNGGTAVEISSGGVYGFRVDTNGTKIGFYGHATASQQQITNNTTGAATTQLVDVTTAAVADPVKINNNFASIVAALQAAGLWKN